MHINNETPNLQPEPKKPEMFNVANMFHAHLKLLKVEVVKLKPYEIKQLKQAFYGGISAHIAMLNSAVTGSEEHAGAILNDIEEQLMNYWASENVDFNDGK